MPAMLLPPALLLAAYLIGSIPFSFVVAKIATGEDIRRSGSGNVGATNVARNAGKLPGVLALVLDIAKGWGATMLATATMQLPDWPLLMDASSAIHSRAFWIGISGFVAVVGHMFPFWLRFEGGKGVATASGVFFAISPLALLIAAVVFLSTALLSKYVSLGSVATAALIPVIMRFVVGVPFWTLIFSILISLLVIAKHRKNIARLVEGDEPKFPR